MHPLTTDLGEQILALIKIQSYSLLGAVQDNKTVLGGSAGSGGGVGDPPAGFVGQLRQANVAYDTTEAAYSGGSTSLVDNLAHIRQEGGGIKNIGQVVSVGVSGCNYTLVSDAVAHINGLGDAAADKPYLIWMMAGWFVDDADHITIPSWVTLGGQGESTTLDLGDWTLIMSANTSLENLVVTSTADEWWYVLDLDHADNAIVDDVRVILTGTKEGGQECIFIEHSDNFELYHVICESTTADNLGFDIYDSTGLLWGCQVDDTTNFEDAIVLVTPGSPSTVTTMFCKFRAAPAGDDVAVLANNTWSHFGCQFDPDNCNLAGTEVPLPHGRSYFKGGLRTRVVSDDVSDPPTDAELDAAFGQPATLGEGFMGMVDDNDAQTKMWLAVTGGSTWWYEELTKAV